MAKKGTKPTKKKTTVGEPSIPKEKESPPTVVENTDLPESLLGFGESFEYKLAPRRTRTTISTPAVEPFPKTVALEVMQAMYEKKQSFEGIKALGKRESRIMSGMLIGEFINALEQIVPNDYVPRGKNKRNLKTEKPKTWKRFAINEPSIRDKLKKFLANGDILIFNVDKNRHMFCLTSTFMPVDKYVGSIFHLLQVRQHLFQSSHWVDTTSKKGHRNWFIPNPFFEGTLADLEALLTLNSDKIWKAWVKDSNSFDPKVVKKLIKSVVIAESG